MYYKQSSGIILVRRSADVPSWVKWVHHSQLKLSVEIPEKLRPLCLVGWYIPMENYNWLHHLGGKI